MKIIGGFFIVLLFMISSCGSDTTTNQEDVKSETPNVEENT